MFVFLSAVRRSCYWSCSLFVSIVRVRAIVICSVFYCSCYCYCSLLLRLFLCSLLLFVIVAVRVLVRVLAIVLGS